MNQKNEPNRPFSAELMLHPLVQGPVIGSTVMALVTPLLKWTNHVYNSEPMNWARPMTGAVDYAVSAVPSYATAFTVKAMLKKPKEKASKTYDLFTSLVAGGASGFVCTPFEAVAQNKQLTKQNRSSMQTAYIMMQANGPTALFQGGLSICFREQLWTVVYMSAIPLMTEALQNKGYKEKDATTYSVVTVAGAYGLFSAPIGQFRFRKQQGLTEKVQTKTYLEHAKDIYNQDPKASSAARVGHFFKAAIPRAVSTTVAAGLLVKGKSGMKKCLTWKNKVDVARNMYGGLRAMVLDRPIAIIFYKRSLYSW